MKLKKLKRSLNGFRYIWGYSFQEIAVDDHPSTVFRKVSLRKNISCENEMEQLYYSCKVFEDSLSNDGIDFLSVIDVKRNLT